MTHTSTLFSVPMPNITAAGLRPIGPPVVSAIQAAAASRAPAHRYAQRLDPWPVAVAKTADRRILRTINDLAFTTEHIIATTAGLARCDISALHHSLQRTIDSIPGYIPPIDLVTTSHQGQRSKLSDPGRSTLTRIARAGSVQWPSTPSFP